MDNISSPLATAAESMSSPMGDFAKRKLSDDWSIELSPIAPSRDNSLTVRSPPMASLVDLNMPSSPLRLQSEDKTKKREGKQGDLLKNPAKSDNVSGVTASPSLSSKTTRTVFRNPYLTMTKHETETKHETACETSGKSDNRSWFLSQESTTPPLSTSSSEFSLESLNEQEGSEAAESLGDGNKEENEKDALEREGDRDPATSTRKPKPEAQRSFQDEDAVPINQDSEPSAPVPSSLEVEPKQSPTPAQVEEPKEKSQLDDVPSRTESATGDDSSTSSHDHEGMNHSAEMSALIEDATLKVRKFIYELSVLDSSISPMNSSEESPASDSSSSQASDAATKEMSEVKNPQGQAEECNKETVEGIRKVAGDSLHLSSSQSSVLSNSTESDLLGSSPNKAKTWLTPTKKGEAHASVDEGTPRTPGKLDFTNAKKEVGQTSFEFIQRIRVGAQRRKQNLARSRDSLVAKEREQREAIASSQMAMKPQSPAPSTPKSHEKDSGRQSSIPSTSFKAKPLPVTTGHFGSGGLAGVPKVAKKPATVPTSPLLGSRRLEQPKIKALKQPVTRPRIGGDRQEAKLQPKTTRMSFPSRKTNGSFKARPAPPTTGELGRSGQSGVPKVPKRPVTIPSSPRLGNRRRHSCMPSSGKENKKQDSRRVSTGMVKWTPSSFQAPKSKASPMSMSSFSQGTPMLLGLDLLSIEPDSPPVTTPPNSQISAFEPRSTQRAKKRAEFDARRAENEQLRLEEEIEDRTKRVQKMYKELDCLREVI